MTTGRKLICRLAALATGLVLTGCDTQAPADELPGPETRETAVDAVPGQLLVKLKPRVTDDAAREEFTRMGCRVIDYFKNPGVYHIALPEKMTISDGLDAIDELGIAEYAEPNVRWRTNPDTH